MPKANPDAFITDFSQGGVNTRTCDHPDCDSIGEYRAPKARDRLNEYYWFCLDHVRDYNRSWNYYAGMSDREVEQDIRRSTTWNRPSWPFGTMQPGQRAQRPIDDPFGFTDDDGDEGDRDTRRRKPADSAEAHAAAVMELEPPFTLERLKARYKELVKKHHPDANGGDKAAEERLKSINEAYTTLRRFLTQT